MSNTKIKKTVFAFFFIAAFLTSLHAQANSSITIVNNTGYEVWYVYFSSTADDSWGQDRLADDEVIPNGGSVRLNLPHPINVVNRYDIMLVDSDGDSYTKMDVLIAANGRIVFTFDDFDAVAYDGPPITIVNNTGYTVYYVYISSSDSEYWGLDRLDRDQTLANGESVTINLPYEINVINRYDIRLTDLDDDTYTKWDVQVTPNSRIEFTFEDYDY